MKVIIDGVELIIAERPFTVDYKTGPDTIPILCILFHVYIENMSYSVYISKGDKSIFIEHKYPYKYKEIVLSHIKLINYYLKLRKVAD